MGHTVRPVWIALAGTTVPDNVEERCRRSLEHIRRFFLGKTGKTFRAGELEIIHTDLSAEHFQEFRPEYAPLLADLNLIFRMWNLLPYDPRLPAEVLFGLNLIAFVRETVQADNAQAWIIFVPAKPREAKKGIVHALHVGHGGYATISANYLAEEFTSPECPGAFYTLDGHTWGSGGRVEGLIAHELSHLFGLHDNLEETGRLMGWRRDQLRDCSITEREKELLLRSPFFTEEKIEG